MKQRLALRVLLLAVVWASLTADPAEAGTAEPGKAHAGPLLLRRDGERLLISFQVRDGLSDEALERIHSGIPLTFRHRIDIVSKRAWLLFPDKLHARAWLESTASYDSLTRRYALRRRFEGRQKGCETVFYEQQHGTTSEQEMRAWMTELSELPVLDLTRVEEEGRLHVRVESTLERRYLLLLIPSSVKVSAERGLEP